VPNEPSNAAKVKVWELTKLYAGGRRVIGDPYVATYITEVDRAFALYIDEVSIKARQVETYLDAVFCHTMHKSERELVRSLMLPVPPDPLEDVAKAAGIGRGALSDLRAELDKRGLVIAKKERGDG